MLKFDFENVWKKDFPHLNSVCKNLFDVSIETLENFESLSKEGDLGIVEFAEVVQKFNFLFDLHILRKELITQSSCLGFEVLSFQERIATWNLTKRSHVSVCIIDLVFSTSLKSWIDFNI